MTIDGDEPLMLARSVIERCRSGDTPVPVVRGFFHEPTNTASYVVHDPDTRAAAIIDSVLDFDAAAGRTGRRSADRMIAYVRKEGLTVEWLLETHAHADHLSAAPYLQECLGGELAIGNGIVTVQNVFGKIFNEGGDFRRGDAVFTGDALFMPDSGAARADFRGGDARQLYRSIRRVKGLPRQTGVFLCHDYKAPGRDSFEWETTIGRERDANVHIHQGVEEDEFVEMRTRRDAMLSVPQLIPPSMQINMRGRPSARGRRKRVALSQASVGRAVALAHCCRCPKIVLRNATIGPAIAIMPRRLVRRISPVRHRMRWVCNPWGRILRRASILHDSHHGPPWRPIFWTGPALGQSRT